MCRIRFINRAARAIVSRARTMKRPEGLSSVVRMTSMRLHDVHVSSRYNYSDHGRLLRPPFHLSGRPGTLPSTGNLLFTHRGDSCTAALRRSPQFRIVSRTSAKLYVRPANYRDCLIKYTPSVSSNDLCLRKHLDIINLFTNTVTVVLLESY